MIMSADNGDKAGQPEAGDEAALSARRQALGAELAARRPARSEPGAAVARGDGQGVGQAMRLGSEFVAGIVVGAAIGWGVDSLFGTRPWGLIGFVLLGFGAGTLNALRSAGLVRDPPGSDGQGGTPPG
jgi:ATP synthase protein I